MVVTGPPASARGESVDAAPASVRPSSRFLAPCADPPRLPGCDGHPARSDRRVPSCIAPVGRAFRCPRADRPRSRDGPRSAAWPGRHRPRRCPVLEATGVGDDGNARGGGIGVLGYGGGRFLREPDSSPLAAAPSLIRLQPRRAQTLLCCALLDALSASQIGSLPPIRHHGAPDSGGPSTHLAVWLGPDSGPSLRGRLPDDEADLTAIVRGCQPDRPHPGTMKCPTRRGDLIFGRSGRPIFFGSDREPVGLRGASMA